jgi:ubiquinone/menaquinone biosynthesis C-methylase UbiE
MEKHSEARETYNRLSRWYDWIAGSEEPFMLQAVAGLGLRPGERVLEIGCGTGKALVEMAARTGQNGCVLGVDLAEGMLRRADARIHRSGIRSIQLCQADAAFLPCANGFYDAVLLTFTLELFPPAEFGPVLAECRRVLRGGGRLGVAALLETDAPGWMERLYGVFHHRYPRLVDCRPIPVVKILRASGFRLLQESQQRMWGLPVVIASAVRED